MLTGRRWGGTPVMSWPSMTTRPPSGISKPASRRSSVVLPQPELPSRANSSPRSTTRSTASTAVTEPKRLVRPSMRTIDVSFIVTGAALLHARQKTRWLGRPVDGANGTDDVRYRDITEVLVTAIQAVAAIVAENEEEAGRHVEFFGVLRGTVRGF